MAPAEGAAGAEGAAACGYEQFVAAVRRQDRLAWPGLELNEVPGAW